MPAISQVSLYGQIQKIEDKDDGTIMVHGIASSEAVDSAGEIIRAEAIRDALPGYLQFPALREMHQLSAAGSTVEASVGDDGFTRIVAHVVDEGAIRKVKNNVYKGFSIGGKVLKRNTDNRKVIEGISLSEISLVDRPCNPDSVLEMWKAELPGDDDETEDDEDDIAAELYKRDFDAKQRKKDAKSGVAMKDGCLTAETLVMTRDGNRPIGGLVGKSLEVLTRPANGSGWPHWAKATIASYGLKPVAPIEFSCGETTITVKASEGHRWLLADGREVLTTGLKVGDCLPFILSPNVLGVSSVSGIAAHANAPTTPDQPPLLGAMNGFGDRSTGHCARRENLHEVQQDTSEIGISPHNLDKQERRPKFCKKVQSLRGGKVSQELLGQNTEVTATTGRGSWNDSGMQPVSYNTPDLPILLEKGGCTVSARLQDLRKDEGAGLCCAEQSSHSSAQARKEAQDLWPFVNGFRADAEGSGRGLCYLQEAGTKRSVEQASSGSLSQNARGSRPTLPCVQHPVGLGGAGRDQECLDVPRWTVTKIGQVLQAEEVFCATVPETGTFVLSPGLLTGNSFPIADKEDLHNAIRLAGKAKNPAAARAHIKRRAAALGLHDEIPDTWKDGAKKAAETESITMAATKTAKVTTIVNTESGETISKAIEPMAISPSKIGDEMGDTSVGGSATAINEPVAGKHVSVTLPGNGPEKKEEVPNPEEAGQAHPHPLGETSVEPVEHVAGETPKPGTDSRTRKIPAEPAPSATPSRNATQDTADKADKGDMDKATEPAEEENDAQDTADKRKKKKAETKEAADDPVAAAKAAAENAMKAATTVMNRLTKRTSGVAAVLLPGMELRKGLQATARLGYLLCEMAYCLGDAQLEKDREGDDSAVPAMLHTAVGALAAAYKAMSEEELQELLDAADQTMSVQIALAAASGDLVKALDGIVDADSVAKVAGAKSDETLAKAQDYIETLIGEREDLLKTVGGLTDQMTMLAERVEELAEMPMPPKTIRKSADPDLVAVSKEQDASGRPRAEETIQKAGGTGGMTQDEARVALEALSEEERLELITKCALHPSQGRLIKR